MSACGSVSLSWWYGVSALAGKHVKPQAMNTVIKIFSIYTMNIPKCKVVRWTVESLALFLLSTPSARDTPRDLLAVTS